MSAYPNLFSPISIRNVTVKNRVAMPPMGTNFAGLDGSVNNDHINYYRQRARGGVGLIIVENSCVDFPMGTNGTTQLRIDNDQYVPGWYKLTETLHAYGATLSIQLNHAGSTAYAGRLGGIQPVSASPVPSKRLSGAIPRPLEKWEIYAIAKRFGEAAARAQRAGFDMVEIHAGHAYLLCQFMSKFYNRRNDEFGGSPENRARFVNLVLDEVRAATGPMFPIGIRVSLDEFLEGGNSSADTLEVMRHFADKVDLINVSAAVHDTVEYQIDSMHLADGWRSGMAAEVKKAFNKPVLTTGNIRNPAVAEKLLADGTADFIGIGRGLIADPNWVEKTEYGQERFLRKCISCNIGCADNRIGRSKPIRCTVNPEVVSENEYLEHQSENPLKVVVVGGGTAGLEAACTAAEVGCQVTLHEGSERLGGLAYGISRIPAKRRIDDFVDYLQARAGCLDNLSVKLGSRAGLESIKKEAPDILVLAAGSNPLLPPIKGLREEMARPGAKVFSILDLISAIERIEVEENTRVAVVGGGAVGLDVVEHFCGQGSKKVSIIEMLPVLGKDLDVITRQYMLAMLERNKVDVFTGTALTEVCADRFKVLRDGKEEEIPFDYGFICLGMRADQTLLAELQDYCRQNRVEFLNIGDSRQARRIIDGTREGRAVITSIDKVNRLRKTCCCKP